MNIEDIIKAVATKAGITTDQARKAVAGVFEELTKSDDENLRKAALGGVAATTATLVTTVMHKP